MGARVLPFPSRPTSHPGQTPTSPPRTPARRRRKLLLVSGATTTAVLAVMAAVLHSSGPTRGAPGTASRPAGHAAASGPAPERRPVDLSWQQRQGVYLPVSASAGPHEDDGVLATGFADSDLGAALAAVHIVYRASPAPGPAVYRAALARQVVGAAEPALAATVEADYASARVASGVPDGAPLGAGTVTFSGYRVTALPDGHRHVQVLERAPDANGVPQVYSLDVVVTRVLGDWRVVAPASGTWASAISQLPAAPAGVTAFTPPAPSASDAAGGS